MKARITLLLMLIYVTSCGLDNGSNEQEIVELDFTEQNEADIVAYIAANELTATRTASGLYYVIDEPGTGAQPNSNSTITVAYKGYYLNGTVFDESNAEGIILPLTNVIAGWREGIPFFKEGGSGMLLIPSHLAYGSYDYSSVPGGSVLIFDINLIAVN